MEALTRRPAGRFRKPEPGKTGAQLTGAERGLAAHLVMQYIHLAKTGSEEEIAGELCRLCEEGFLSEAQAASVAPEEVRAFFQSELGQRMLRADRVIREFRFSLLCPAERWFSTEPGEEILLQGVVDCCMEEQGELTVLDFKTDGQVEPERYAGQLAAYAMAMERIFQKPVRGAALWYLRKKQAVWVMPEEKT